MKRIEWSDEWYNAAHNCTSAQNQCIFIVAFEKKMRERELVCSFSSIINFYLQCIWWCVFPYNFKLYL